MLCNRRRAHHEQDPLFDPPTLLPPALARVHPRLGTPYRISAVTGLFVGALARLALPGRDPMSIFQTILLGLAGNFIAGILVWLIWRRGVPGVLLSVLCSAMILYLIRRSRGGSLTRSGTRLR